LNNFLNIKQDQNLTLRNSITQQQQGEPTQGTLPASIYASSRSSLFQGVAGPAKRREAMVKLSVNTFLGFLRRNHTRIWQKNKMALPVRSISCHHYFTVAAVLVLLLIAFSMACRRLGTYPGDFGHRSGKSSMRNQFLFLEAMSLLQMRHGNFAKQRILRAAADCFKSKPPTTDS
jgi:hypothetical protein